MASRIAPWAATTGSTRRPVMKVTWSIACTLTGSAMATVRLSPSRWIGSRS